MRILHFITSMRTGGAERLMLDLLPRLRDYGHETELLLMDGSETPFLSEMIRRGIPVHALGLGHSAMHDISLLWPLRRFLRSRHFDIVHTHNTPCQLLGALAAPRGTYLVTTEHNTSNRRRGSIFGRMADRLLYARYSRIIACGDETAASLRAWLPSLGAKIHTVANGIDTDSFAGANPAADIAARFAGHTIITMVAAFRTQKDQPTLLRALALLPDSYALVLVGNGATMQKCRRLAAELGIERRVMFAGERSDIAAVYAASDIAVLSTRHEGLSLSAIESMAAGLPLIASDVEGLRDTVVPGALLFPEGNETALAATIQTVCSNRRLRDDTAAACAVRAAAFSIRHTAEGYNEIYIHPPK